MASMTERLYIKQGVECDVRLDGRRRMDYRPFQITTDFVNNASGSARVTLDETEVIAVVKGAVGPPDSSSPNSGRVVCAVNCSASISESMDNRQVENYNTELSCQLQRLLVDSRAIEKVPSLVIIPGKTVWVLNIDVLVTNSGGSVMDAMALAVKAALRTTRLPRLTVIQQESGELDFDVSDDPYATVAVDDTHVPLAVTLTKIGNVMVIDATREEELCQSATLTVMVTQGGQIAGMRKAGLGALAPSALCEATSVAHRIGMALASKLPVPSTSSQHSGAVAMDVQLL